LCIFLQNLPPPASNKNCFLYIQESAAWHCVA
jgi:hypothetical protein